MAVPNLTAEEVLAWLEKTSAGWRELIEQNPQLLNTPCDIAGTRTVGGLLQHIVAVELRYAERLAGLPATDYANVPYDSAAAITPPTTAPSSSTVTKSSAMSIGMSG